MNPPPLEPKEKASASMHVRDPRNSITANAPEFTHPSDSGFPPKGALLQKYMDQGGLWTQSMDGNLSLLVPSVRNKSI